MRSIIADVSESWLHASGALDDVRMPEAAAEAYLVEPLIQCDAVTLHAASPSAAAERGADDGAAGAVTAAARPRVEHTPVSGVVEVTFCVYGVLGDITVLPPSLVLAGAHGVARHAPLPPELIGPDAVEVRILDECLGLHCCYYSVRASLLRGLLSCTGLELAMPTARACVMPAVKRVQRARPCRR